MNIRTFDLLPASFALAFLVVHFAHDQALAEQLLSVPDSKLTATLLHFARMKRQTTECEQNPSLCHNVDPWNDSTSDSVQSKEAAALANQHRLIKTIKVAVAQRQKRDNAVTNKPKPCITGIGGGNCDDSMLGPEGSPLIGDQLDPKNYKNVG